MQIALALLACYLLGSLPIGLIIGKITRGIDIRDFGSGNIGASNVLRTLGIGWGVTVFVCDTLKGAGCVFLCKKLGLDPWLVVSGAMLGVCGHNFSIFLKFKGGKGVATSLGVIIGLDPIIALVTFAIWGVIVGITRYISVASILASLSVPFQMIFWKPIALPYQILAGVAAFAILLKHTSNIKRLVNGTESKIGQKVDIEKESQSNES